MFPKFADVEMHVWVFAVHVLDRNDCCIVTSANCGTIEMFSDFLLGMHCTVHGIHGMQAVMQRCPSACGKNICKFVSMRANGRARASRLIATNFDYVQI